MAEAVRVLKRKAAKRPKLRTVTFTAPDDSDYPGWSITIRADFPAKRLAAFQSGRIADMIEALDGIVIDHNLPDENDEIASTLNDVDPYEGLLFVVDGAMDEIAKLPPR